jgi:hypothetical protein
MRNVELRNPQAGHLKPQCLCDAAEMHGKLLVCLARSFSQSENMACVAFTSEGTELSVVLSSPEIQACSGFPCIRVIDA